MARGAPMGLFANVVGVVVGLYFLARTFVGPPLAKRGHALSWQEIPWAVSDGLSSLGFLYVAIMFFLASFD